MNLDKMLNLFWMLDLTIFQWANAFKIISSPSFLRKNSSLIWLLHSHFDIWRVHLGGANIAGTKIGNLDVFCIWGLERFFLRNSRWLIEKINLLRSENGLLTKSSHVINLVRLGRSLARFIGFWPLVINPLPVTSPIPIFHLYIAFPTNFFQVSVSSCHMNIKAKDVSTPELA